MKNIPSVFLLALICLFPAARELGAAQYYLVADNQTGYILGAKGKDTKVQVASLTKIATAAVVLDYVDIKSVDLSRLLDVPDAALKSGTNNPLNLQAGDKVSVRDLLYSMLLASDNVAAGTLAYNIGSALPNASGLDPIGNFVANMNALARSIGMKHTLFLNPTGYDGGEKAVPHSTAADMARLTRYAYDKNGFSFYVSQKSREVHVIRGAGDLPYHIQNTNRLLGQDGIDGVKTGSSAHAGDCLILSAAQRPESVRQSDTKVLITPRRIIVVLLSSPDQFGEGLQAVREGWQLYDQWAAGGRKLGSSHL